MSTTALGDALRWGRTVRNLAPSQIAHRLRLRAQKGVMAVAPGVVAPRLRHPVPDTVGWPEGWVPLDARLAGGFPSAEANAEGRFLFLQHERRLGVPPDWEQARAEQLWRYHLHYLEWAWAFAAHPDRQWARTAFARLWCSWASHTTFGRWDAWSPYVVALRAWVLCGVYRSLIAGGPHEEKFRADLGLHAGFVRANLEFDVGGNHLVKNLKALVGLGVFLGDDSLVRLARRHLERQIALQVLADGGHFELSPSYHSQVLGDLIDVGELLERAGQVPVEGLAHAVQAMRDWLGVMLLPDGEVPMFNDCTAVGRERLELLEPTPAPHRRLVVLRPSGYVVVRPDERLHLVADVGSPCPARLPAHAHADCLSFELAVDSERVIVNSGTSTYRPGRRRAYERSTRAHNTVEVDGQDQTEVWGAFRAARRARPLMERAGDDGEVIEVTAAHDGYRRLAGSPVHRRTWRVRPGSVEIVDDVVGRGTHTMTTSIHAAPAVAVAEIETPPAWRVGPLLVTTSSGGRLRRRPWHAAENGISSSFGPPEPAATLELVTRRTLPMRQQLRLVAEPLAERQVAGPEGSRRRETTR